MPDLYQILEWHFNYNFYPPVVDTIIISYAEKLIQEIRDIDTEEEVQKKLVEPSIIKDYSNNMFLDEFQLWELLEN